MRGKVSKGIALWVLPPAALAVLIVMAAPGDPGQAQEQPPAGKVVVAATVDMSRVYKGSDQWRDAIAGRKKMTDDMKRTLDPLRRELKLLAAELKGQPPGTEEYRKALNEYAQAQRKLQEIVRDMETRISEHFQAAYRDMMSNIGAAASRHAQERGIDIILKIQRAGEDPLRQEGLMDIHTNQIIYAAPRLDISEAIIEALNAGYEAPLEVD